ncbi:MAG: PUR family DNA/RNA-binding protein [Bacteroidales bacterium]|nr:PUR family DNA/RNA-binding protein [Bacteroidales bacterium]
MDKTEDKDFANDGHSRKDEIYSKAVRAGKRTYFFDVKITSNDDHYLTITESRRSIGSNGAPVYEKHKIFLYKEDFEKFITGLTDAISFIDTEVEDLGVENPDQGAI